MYARRDYGFHLQCMITCIEIGDVGHAHWHTGTGRRNRLPRRGSPRIRRVRG